MDKSAYEIRKEQWRQTVSECINSGINKTEWCHQNGISLRSMYYWMKKFRDEAIMAQSPTSLPAVACEETTAASADTGNAVFVDLTDKLDASVSISESSPVKFAPELMINSNGIQIYVCSNIQAKTLDTVMKVITHA